MMSPSEVKKILIIQTASIGDVILTTPLIEKAHASFPEAGIDVLVKKGIESLFINHPFIHRLITWDKSEKKYKNLLGILFAIQDNQYDLLINVQRFTTTGILTAFSKAKHTVGFNKNPLSLFFSKRVKHRIRSGNFHETDRNQRLIEHLTGDKKFRIKLYPSKTDFAKTSQFKTVPYITLSPASLWFTKQYPEEKWIDFVHNIPLAIRIYFLGSPADEKMSDSIIKRSGNKNSLNLCGKLTLLESAALMKDAQMNFMNDSAPLHLASSVNAPTTAIFCSTVPEFGFGPKADDAVVVETKEYLDCRPCGLHGFKKCPKKHFKCALTIDNVDLLKRLGNEGRN